MRTTLRVRVPWIDASRAICVLAIVLMHLQIWVITPFVGKSSDVTFWLVTIAQLNSFRLPLLFVMAGMLASRRIRAGWSRKNLTAAAASYYLYVVWLAIYLILTVLIPTRTPMGVPDFWSLVTQLVLPRSILWFVFALAVYGLVLALAARIRPAAVISALVLLSVSTIFMPGSDGADLYLRVAYYAVFFAAGVYGRSALMTFAESNVVAKFLIAVSVYLLLFWVSVVDALANPVAGVLMRLARESAASLAALTLIVLICKVPILARPLVAIGRHTLPIYVLQMPFIWMFLMYQDWADLLQSPLLRAAMPAIGVAAISAASLAVHWVLMRTPLRWAFAMPFPTSTSTVRRVRKTLEPS